jgi:DNA-directed RNA polymerase specialized sigma24 family protein
MVSPGQITVLLQKAEQGDAEAKDQLFTLVESDMRRIAAKHFWSAVWGVDLSPTMLIGDAFQLLVGKNQTEWRAGDSGKFFGYVKKNISNLVKVAFRKSNAVKRGGAGIQPGGRPTTIPEAQDNGNAGWRRVELDAALESPCDNPPFQADLAMVKDEFATLHPQPARIFDLHVFADQTFREIAGDLRMSEGRAKAGFYLAKAWYRRKLKDYGHDQ